MLTQIYNNSVQVARRDTKKGPSTMDFSSSSKDSSSSEEEEVESVADQSAAEDFENNPGTTGVQDRTSKRLKASHSTKPIAAWPSVMLSHLLVTNHVVWMTTEARET